MDAKVFSYLVTLAEEGSFSSAATKSFMTPQGFTGAIRRLEKEFRVPLVHARGGRIELTEYGEVLVKHARSISRQIDEAHAQIDYLLNEKSKSLTLCASYGLINYFPENTLDLFNTSNTFGCEVSLTKTASDFDCEAAVLNRECDFALVVNPIEHDLFHSRPIHQDHMFAWIHESSPHATRNALSIRDFAGCKVLFLSGEFKQSNVFSQAIAQLPTHKQPRDVAYVDEMIEVLQRAAHEHCAALTVRRHAVGLSIEGLRGIPITDFDWGFSLICRRDRLISPADDAFMRFFEDRSKFYC